MAETIFGSQSYDERLAGYKASFKDVSMEVLFEIANTQPGGELDAPFAPIDPAECVAARKLIEENELGKDFDRYRFMLKIR